MLHHQSVLVKQVLSFLNLPKRSIIVDATVGLGGHSKAILSSPDFSGSIIAMDQDARHLDEAKKNLEVFKNQVSFFHANFEDLEKLCRAHALSFDAIFFDLGVASSHLDEASRGFSFQQEGPLDMRMNPNRGRTAADIVNTFSEHELAKIFHDYGEEPLARVIARAIVYRRTSVPFSTTKDLASVVRTCYHLKHFFHSQKNPATKIFQALRIAVNHELDALKKALDASVRLLPPGGRILVISYHSLEDRIVKKRFKQDAHPCICPPKALICSCEKKPLLRILTKKPVLPDEIEKSNNGRARSAKLRVAEKL